MKTTALFQFYLLERRELPVPGNKSGRRHKSLRGKLIYGFHCFFIAIQIVFFFGIAWDRTCEIQGG